MLVNGASFASKLAPTGNAIEQAIQSTQAGFVASRPAGGAVVASTHGALQVQHERRLRAAELFGELLDKLALPQAAQHAPSAIGAGQGRVQ